MIEDLPISGIQIQRIQIATANDCDLQKLKDVVIVGRPDNIRDLDTRHYWHIRDDIHNARWTFGEIESYNYTVGNAL